MVKVGDLIKVTRKGLPNYNKTYRIRDYRVYFNEGIGEYIKCYDPFTKTDTVIGVNDFTIVNYTDNNTELSDNNKEFEVGDPVIISEEVKTKGTKQPFYRVLQTDENGVAIADDNGCKHWFQKSNVRKVNLDDDIFAILAYVGRTLNEHEKMFKEFYQKLANLSQEMVDKLNN